MDTILLDASILVRAFLTPGSERYSVLRKAQASKLFFSPFILSGVGRTLHAPRIRKKYQYSDAEIENDVAELASTSTLIEPAILVEACSDPPDNAVLSHAVVAHADYLVTRNVGHFPKVYEGVKVVRPEQFLAMVRQQNASNRLRICLDVRTIRSNMTGLGRYALNLVRGIADIDAENEYLLLKHPAYPSRIVERPNFREIPLAGDPSFVGSVLKSAAHINRLKPDVYHSFMHFLPFGIDCPRRLITLHDLIWIETPQLSFSNPLKAFYNRHVKGRFIKYAVRNADAVIAVSEATRQRSIEVLGMPAEKCRVIYPGIEGKAAKEADRERVDGPSKPFREMRDYILSLGHSKPYKNVEGIICAFKLLCGKYPALKLLIIGRGDRYSALQKLVAELQLTDRVIFWSSRTDGPLTDGEITELFQRAKMLAFPSFVEGFGFPIVEAMAVGCPVLTSNLSAPREIAGAAAVLVNPHDVRDIANGMERLLNDKTLLEEMISKGRHRAREFTVERCARETHRLYTAVSMPQLEY